MQTVNQRIITLINLFAGGKQNVFCELTGLTTSNVSNYIKEGHRVYFDVIQTIKTVFPTVSCEWLITGNGSMLLDGSVENEVLSMVSEPLINYRKSDKSKVDEMRELNYLEQIAELKGQIADLKSQLDKTQNSDSQEVK